MLSQTGLIGAQGSNYSNKQFGGEKILTDYMKGLNQSATNANKRAMEGKGSQSSMDRKQASSSASQKQHHNGAMTPSIERQTVYHKVKNSQQQPADR